MEQNSITTAPYIPDIEGVYKKWQVYHDGSMDDFYEFMITPSIKREVFLNSIRDCVKIEFVGNCALMSIQS